MKRAESAEESRTGHQFHELWHKKQRGIFGYQRSMKLSIVSCNVRGLNCERRRGLIRNMLLNWKADVVCLQETKLEGDISNIVKETMYNWRLVEQRGSSDHMGQEILGRGTEVERDETWWELGAAGGWFLGLGVLCGDFNTVRYPTEKRDGIRINRSMTEF
ncbi:hypothetical protein H5410_057772 [Solanum commersonii]|uniref:Endonuclease/exonuclease/phosphatase domain-containing protein n=1 Tax=Solanum commersonii TaxID=4109 RepID=A0A9J5WRS6_SOLCO|nr:hypothetical protein H5410_057772 [Solanum commersonii]